MTVWSERRGGKGPNPRGQAEAGWSTKEPEKCWLLGQQMPRTGKLRRKRVANRSQIPFRSQSAWLADGVYKPKREKIRAGKSRT